MCCRRPHQSLASVGVAALVQLVTAAGDQMDAATWVQIVQVRPAFRDLLCLALLTTPFAASTSATVH